MLSVKDIFSYVIGLIIIPVFAYMITDWMIYKIVIEPRYKQCKMQCQDKEVLFCEKSSNKKKKVVVICANEDSPNGGSVKFF